MFPEKRKAARHMRTAALLLGAAFTLLLIAAKKAKPSTVYDDKPTEKSPFEGKRIVFVKSEEGKENADGVKGHLEVVGEADHRPSIYEKYGKRALDIALSFGGLVVGSPLMLAIAACIYLEDPGPVVFTQKRFGQNKQYFKLHKFRSMKLSAPHDVPTHQLENPGQYILRAGAFARRHSLDEIPQLWDIFVGNMSIVGPRPALWNQEFLMAERDKYGANDVKPGLTGLAQINGRDELEIPEKARLDGEYVERQSFLFDAGCFFATVKKIGHDETIVEGGTGEMEKHGAASKIGRGYTDGKSDAELIGHIGFGAPVEVDASQSKRVLITGAGSYIGESFRAYAVAHYPSLIIDTIDMVDGSWRKKDFSSYDIVYHVAGIAHADVGNVDDETKEKYYAVNTDLAVEVCRKAKNAGVKEFIFMSSMILYGDSAPYGKQKIVDEHTVPKPANFYGDSKLQADVGVREEADENFRVIVLRPPMIYGRGSKGNYPTLAKLAKRLPIFPDVENERSMLYIENLCEFLCQVMLVREIKPHSVVLMPQNAEWTKTSEMVRCIALASGKPIKLLKAGSLVALGGKVPGGAGKLVKKAFGNSCYAHALSIYPGLDYQKVGLEESIERTEGEGLQAAPCGTERKKSHILVISQYFYPEQFRINDICQEWVKRGHKVTVVTGIPNYPQGDFYDGYDYDHKRTEHWNGIDIVRLPIKPRKSGNKNLAMNYLSFVTEGHRWVQKTNISADKVFVYEVSPMTQALVGVWYAKKRNIDCYLYVTDLWPENVEIALGTHNKALLGLISLMVDYIYRHCKNIFTSSESFIERIAQRGVDKKKLTFWPQYAEDFYKKADRGDPLEIPDDGNINLVFAGNIGTAQGLDVLVKAASCLKKDGIYVRINMIGNGRYEDKLKSEIKTAKVETYFNFIDRKPAEKIPEYFAWCDAALITLSKNEIYAMTVPAKTQSCLACAMPIIASADGELQEIIRKANCGLCSDSGDYEKLADNINDFMHMSEQEKRRLSENAVHYYKEHFDKKRLLNKMEDYL